jgi:hypothetical protein
VATSITLISVFRHGVDEVFALLSLYASCVGSCLPTFRDGPLDCLTVEDGTDRLPRNAVQQLPTYAS